MGFHGISGFDGGFSLKNFGKDVKPRTLVNLPFLEVNHKV